VPLLVVISLLREAIHSAFLEEGDDPPNGDCVGGEFVWAEVHILLADGAQPFLPFHAIPVVVIGLRGFRTFRASGLCWSCSLRLQSWSRSCSISSHVFSVCASCASLNAFTTSTISSVTMSRVSWFSERMKVMQDFISQQNWLAMVCASFL
jgi:hypothetical protein